MVIYCAVCDCKSTDNDDERLFYPFPKDEERCSAWVDAIERPELCRMTAQNLHDDYRVCDLHFVFLDHHKILLDDAVPSIIGPQETYLKKYTPLVEDDAVPGISEPKETYSKDNLPYVVYEDDAVPGLSEKQEPYLKNNIPHVVCEIQSIIDDDRNKSTQTVFSCISESTQTIQTCLKTLEIACQTDSEDGYDSQQVAKPLKRKLFTAMDLNHKVPKCAVQTIDYDDAACDTKITASYKNDVVSLMCQPDISFIMSKDNNKPENVKSRKVSPAQRSSRTRTAAENKPKPKKGITKSTRRRRPSTESSSENELDKAYNPLINTRLDEAIRLVQKQWEVYGQNYYRKDLSDNADYPVDLLNINQGRYCSNELKYIALYLFYSNIFAYKTLREPLNLPTEKTLRKAKVGISTKLTPTVIKCLKLKVGKLKENEKFCTLCADIFPLKKEIHKFADTDKYIGFHEINEVQWPELATKTLVVLVKGLYSDWLQPLTTCYLKDNFDFSEVNLWLDEIIAILIEIGLKVVSFTTNENTGLVSMAKERNISVERPYFFVNGHRIYYIFDIFHTMMSLRNLFYSMLHVSYIDIDGTEQIASWFDIEKVFATDQTRACKLAPDLTEKHIIDLYEMEKNGVQLSVQIFSKSVATGIITCIKEKHLTEKSLGTVKLVKLINNVFDVLSSRDDKDMFNLKDQIEVLEKMLNVIRNLKIIAKNQENRTSSEATFRCLGITIRSILSIASDQKSEGFECLCPRNVTLELLYAFFESLRKKLGNITTSVLFNAGFRRYFMENVIEQSESNNSCSLDKDLISIFLENSNYLESRVSRPRDRHRRRQPKKETHYGNKT